MSLKAGPYLRDLHAFRGVAILAIVMAHAVGVVLNQYARAAGESNPWPVVRAVQEALWHDSTIYFALISGILFSAVLASRGWRAFFRSKLLHVALPYVVMTALFTLVTYRAGTGGQGFRIRVGAPGGFLNRFAEHLLEGTALMPYWYIPVLLCLFALTPLVWRIARRAPAGMAFLALLPLLISRTGIVFSFQSVVYFLGVYAVGIAAGMDFGRTRERLRSARPALLAAALVTTALLLTAKLAGWNWRAGWLSPVESLFYVQKLSVSGLVLGMLEDVRGGLARLLDLCARYAFGIFFLHIIPLRMAVDVAFAVAPPPFGPLMLQLVIGGVFLAGTSASLAVSAGLARLFGRHSRKLVGA